MLTEHSRLRLAPDVTHQSMGPDADTVLLSLSSGRLFTCNETTASFLAAVDGKRSFAQIVNALAEEYDVPRPQLEGDLKALVEQLMAEKLIVVEDDPDGR